MSVFLRTSIAIALFATMMVNAATFSWWAGWVSHGSAHDDRVVQLTQDPSSNTEASIYLTDIQHQLLHELSHLPIALTDALQLVVPTPACSFRSSCEVVEAYKLAFTPPFRPPKSITSF